MFRPCLIAFLGLTLACAASAASPPPAPPKVVVPRPDPSSPRSPTLKAIRAAGRLSCAVVAPADDWNNDDTHGDLSAFEAQLCAALAAATLGDPTKVDIQASPGEIEAGVAVERGEAQVAIGLAPSTGVAAAHSLVFGRPVFYDSVRVLTHKDSGLHKVDDLGSTIVCTMNSTRPEVIFGDLMAARGLTPEMQRHSELNEFDSSINVRRCGAGVGMETRLAQSREAFRRVDPTEFAFLPGRLSISPLATATRAGDPLWSMLVDDLVDALLQAEALGIDQAHVADALERKDLGARELSGDDIAIAYMVGLDERWALKAVAAAGNYGEIYERTIGRPYRIERGLNALWNAGGLMVPHELR